ncbi:glycine cleavage system protein GcvH [Methylophaga sp. OBS4]|uniref:glycine cleavage system protein GcvH n=1 Tax=Methylophaga sp. OBS4 TaxID=2991935 RepID=UPI0022508675|nr:glycine cleavage system protein GcvH [Methylophaga sp. OBS4]MCX4186814.1 glycine cleavage system protein GcvH [Methylophaga sp. OBS4]
MESNPDHLRYAPTHEWVSEEGADELTVGITDYAQDQLGDVVYVSLPQPDMHFQAGDVCMFIESVKSASDIHMPVNGTILAVNGFLEDSPELVNQDAFGEGWLFKVRPDDDAALDALLDSFGYEAALDE